jgi:hypothetical protein
VLEDVWSFLDDQVDVAKGHILDLRLGRQQSDQWRSKFFGERCTKVTVRRQNLEQFHQNLKSEN